MATVRMYQWMTDDEGQRVFRVTDLRSGRHVDVPKDAGYARVRKNHQGALDDQELVVAKVVCDKTGSLDDIEKWLAGPADNNTIAEYRAAMAERDAAKAELEAALQKLKDAGIA
jgi:hypothetical protein